MVALVVVMENTVVLTLVEKSTAVCQMVEVGVGVGVGVGVDFGPVVGEEVVEEGEGVAILPILMILTIPMIQMMTTIARKQK